MYSATLAGAILRGWAGGGEKREGRPPLPLFENRRKFPDFGKKDPGPGCVHLWVTFCNQNMVLTVTANPLFLAFLTKRLSKCPSSTNLRI